MQARDRRGLIEGEDGSAEWGCWRPLVSKAKDSHPTDEGLVAGRAKRGTHSFRVEEGAAARPRNVQNIAGYGFFPARKEMPAVPENGLTTLPFAVVMFWQQLFPAQPIQSATDEYSEPALHGTIRTRG